MKRIRPAFDAKEAAILVAMYEAGNATFTSYTLAWTLNPTVARGTPAALAAFTEARDATERLIVQGLVKGKRFTGADGVYFNDLQLTPKGERSAIQQRQTNEETKKALAEAIKRADAVTEEMRKSGKKET